MKDTLEVKNRQYDYTRVIQEKLGLDYSTLLKWVKSGLLPQPMKLGNRSYYDRAAVETAIMNKFDQHDGAAVESKIPASCRD